MKWFGVTSHHRLSRCVKGDEWLVYVRARVCSSPQELSRSDVEDNFVATHKVTLLYHLAAAAASSLARSAVIFCICYYDWKYTLAEAGLVPLWVPCALAMTEWVCPVQWKNEIDDRVNTIINLYMKFLFSIKKKKKIQKFSNHIDRIDRFERHNESDTPHSHTLNLIFNTRRLKSAMEKKVRKI